MLALLEIQLLVTHWLSSQHHSVGVFLTLRSFIVITVLTSAVRVYNRKKMHGKPSVYSGGSNSPTDERARLRSIVRI